MLELVSCAGGNARFAEIAVAAGYRYGVRLPDYTAYAPVWFADQDWRRPDRAAYMAALARHRPHMATVVDWERDEQLPDVLDWAEEAAPYVERVLIVPKVIGETWRLPQRIGGREVVLAYSVPTAYGGTQVPSWEFAGRAVHLLGGSPHAQMRIYRHMAAIADVVSVDGNMANKMAHRCQFWDDQAGPKGHWRQLYEIGLGAFGTDSNAEAFRRSCDNIMEAWRAVCS